MNLSLPRSYFRGMRLISWLDVKLGVRMLARYPGLSLASAFAIAVVVACGTAAAAFDAVVNGSLPFEDGDRIVAIENWDAKANEPQARPLHDLETWKRDLRTVRDIGAYRLQRRNLSIAGRISEPVTVAEISASAFRMARVPPIRGRTLIDADEAAGAEPVLVIGYDAWQDTFAGDARVIGQRVLVGAVPHTVIGVMPDGFGFPERENYWVPLRLQTTAFARGQGPTLYAFGRLAEGADLEAAQAEAAVVGERTARDFPDTHAQLRPRVLPYTQWFFWEMQQGETWMAQSLLLLGVVGANVAVLIYARTATRRGEIAVRTAIGASRRRIVAQLFAEGLVLSALAAGAGLAIAAAVRPQLDLLIAQAPFWVDATLTSVPVIRNVLALIVLGAVVTGVIPALQATGRRAQTGLHHASASAARWKIGRTYGALIVVQVALAVAILPLALATTWRTVQEAVVDPGFPAGEFLLARLDYEQDDSADGTRVARFADREAELVRRLQADPSVAAVSFLLGLPGNDPNTIVQVEGEGDRVHEAGHARLAADFDRIGVDVRAPFNIPLLAGRDFEARDIESAARPVMVNRTFAQRILGGNEIGRRVRETDDARRPGPWLVVVGVIGDFPVPATPASARAMLFHPVARAEAPVTLLAVHVRGRAPESFGGGLRRIAEDVDRGLQLSFMRRMDETLRRSQAELRLAASVTSLITGSVLLLSATGLYALIAFTVAQRRREIGLRIALGSSRRRILGQVMSRSLWQLGIGTTLGFAAAYTLFREGEITGESSGPMFFLVAMLVFAIGLLAAAAPARRALRIQPTEALRDQ